MNERNLAARVRRAGRVAAVSAITLGSLALAGAANAETATVKDAHGDMQGHGADIHKVRVVNEKAVRVVVHHKNLVRSFESGASIKMYVDTDRDRKGPEYLFTGALFEGGDYALMKAEDWKGVGVIPLQTPYIMKLDYADDITRIRFSQKALGRPDEVRVTVKVGGELDNGDHATDWLKGTRKFTRWVARG